MPSSCQGHKGERGRYNFWSKCEFFTPSFPLYQSNAEEQNDLGRHLLKMVELQGR